MTAQTVPKPWWGRRYLKARPRLLTGVLVAAATAAVLQGTRLPHALGFMLGFDLGALLYLFLIVRTFRHASPSAMRDEARTQDVGRWSTLLAGVVVSAAVLVAVSTELESAQKGGAIAIAIAATTLILAWAFMNTLFALHYAHGFYGNFGDQHKGLDFPGDDEPDYWDFAYFSFTIGMTFQVSDVQISTRYLRRIALMHSAIAFFFNVFIIAISVNIAAGKA
ncbi:DUF1345 domain-containing protein [Luteibacter sp.]|uniref:DUF1345 domain-containing protein n=1 Tax=Luteibacter sp. TaxID=1886636 RepID=UPI003F8198D6